ncbi:uncharacterized protein LAESUDRAFT_715402 [Laetiporus sulphureus 93-53]|uniref:Xylanolytic transcriptional activator regulatory domain-containing protein n=1 Tax=Laetiporus sulphureus 93-53 TaxID=1314785 RepID=A0A165DCV0_9APHY|nr:uncharacterized protein LAESUDRAFT_715402 [Laetiporus sulphureus 93-53]KZT04585.1 hypothetical protein LAESUDRAFT_715402 [Laetiporus sulphureus 93-53]
MSPAAQEEGSERSEEELQGGDGASGSAATQSIKRTSRECTFSGPIFRRGPPKGYIQALERRLHQMESVLAAIMSSKDPRTKGIVADLKRDSLARSILDGVDSGPFGPSGRSQRSVDPTQDNFFASIVSVAQQKQVSDRSRRQSRVTRESVTQKDPTALARPTLEWQDRLSQSLAHWSGQQQEANTANASRSLDTAPQAHPPDNARRPTNDGRERAKRKRRLAPASNVPDPEWNDLHPMDDTDKDELDDCADAFGNLSIDENKEVRYHGNSSGLIFLARDKRWDARNVGGIWNFPMSKLWPGGLPTESTNANDRRGDADIRLPSYSVQDELVEMYFTYINSAFPVIDKEAFVEQYEANKRGYQHESSNSRIDESLLPLKPERMQKLSELLLFAMFAFAQQPEDPKLAAQYAISARKVLDKMYQESRTSTVQALILLGVRELGIGSLEEGWLHVGMAVRMAYDLGLNRNSEKWQNHGEELFTAKENSIRRRIWWACCLADRYSAQTLGRPMAIHEGDFSTPLPEVSERDAEEQWIALHTNSSGHAIPPAPARSSSFFRETASLSVIHEQVIEKIYPVTRVSTLPRRQIMEELHTRLMNWSINLPEPLKFSSTSKKPCPAPHILTLHCQYWAVMLYLHRPFIPKNFEPSSNHADAIPWKSLDYCQSAASHIATFATFYHQNYDLKWGSPFFTTYLQSAGTWIIPERIACGYAVKHRHSEPRAMLGLRDCIAACDHMRGVWPMAARVGDLLRGASVHFNLDLGTSVGPSRKRPAENMPDTERMSQSHQQDYQALVVPTVPPATSDVRHSYATPQTNNQSRDSVQDLHASLLADFFDPGIPFPTPAAPIMPSYDWWPAVSASENVPWTQNQEEYNPYLAIPSQSFTFGQQHLSPDFLHGIRDPVLHFPSAFLPR